MSKKLIHYGILRKSGRYPWGSGANPYQRSQNMYSMIAELKDKGMSDSDIAKALGFETTTEFRAAKSMGKDEIRSFERAEAIKLKNRDWSTTAIAERMGKPESSVRALLKDYTEERVNITKTVASKLKDQVDKHTYIDVGAGTENHLGVSKERLNTAIAILKDEGYEVKYTNVKQLGTGEMTSLKVLVPPGVTAKDVYHNKDQIRTVADVASTDGGRTFLGLNTPKSVSSKKLAIRYAEDGGTDMDGVIELRPGVKDLDLGKNRYAQVRIAVDGTHYLKGMAIYADDLPDGADIRFNTNKKKTEAPNKLDALKAMKDDPDNPFGSQIKGGALGQRGALNIVNEEGDWYNWSRKLSSQMLSKQKPELIKQQLDLTYDIRKAELDEINSLTNPTIKKKLLQSFADNADSAAVHLRVMGLPGTRNHVILPIPNMSDKEIYAPGYSDGDRVVLIRHPHGGIFEIPELTVNNRQRAAKKLIGQSLDAVGINPIVAEQLSGADFDGDTVLVIPQKPGVSKIQTKSMLKELREFDPRSQYKAYDGMKVMNNTQAEMGKISNLITDMTIRGANTDEIVRAVKHSMVVIDAEKHKLNYKQSEIDNGIKELKKLYQEGGASTLISRAKGDVRVPARKPRLAQDGGPIDKRTGKRVYVETGETYVNSKGETVPKMFVSTKMAETDDARKLMSANGGTEVERLYANYANQTKALANQARKDYLNTPNLVYSRTANRAYNTEVEQLKGKLNVALKNAPIERQAQLAANAIMGLKKADNPGMDRETQKKLEAQALSEARLRLGAKKQQITITPREWEAIQAGAISNNMLEDIIKNADVDSIKELAMPRAQVTMTPSKVARAQAMARNGVPLSDIARALGVSVSTINDVVN